MRLYEHEGKALLALFGIPVPCGALWPQLPPTEGPWVVKAQVPAGRRGSQGGIRFAATPDSCRRAAAALLSSTVGGYRVDRVYIEEWLDVARGIYVSIIADRDRRAPVLVAAAVGGTNVEEVPAEEIVELPIDPLIGLHPDQLRYTMQQTRIPPDLTGLVAATVKGLYRAFRDLDAELVEVNPLTITRAGRVVAADAKVVLDDNAAFRHPEWPRRDAEGTAFEQRCTALGAVGVEMEGTIAAIVSGAGLMMATVDLLVGGGGRIRAAVDLGGTVFLDPSPLGDIVRTTLDLNPRVLLVNAFFQLASGETLASGLVAALTDRAFAGRVVVRIKGRGLPEARAILARLRVPVVEDLAEACRIAVAGGEDKADGHPG